MKRTVVAALGLAGLFMLPTLAQARFSFTIGDNVYADGRWFTVEEYQEYKKTHPEAAGATTTPTPPATQQQPGSDAPTRPMPSASPSVAALPTPADASADAALRAASCRTTKTYEEFPGEGEKFDCGVIGQLTRQEMLAQGWKIDFVEKLPAVAGQVAPSMYKIILSR